jgi:membrane fusion protein, peptide pheromone/bacteriocin exporter
MQKNIFPLPPDVSIESHSLNNEVKTKIIYIVSIITIIVAIISLPFIKVSLSIQGRGIIRPITEKAEIKAIQTEQITKINISEGQQVYKGDTLIILRQDILNSKLGFLNQELSKQQIYITDLEKLVRDSNLQLKSNVYISQYNSFKQKLNELDGKITKAKTELDRNKTLFDKEIISKKDYNDLQFNLNQLVKEKSIMESNQITQWKDDFEEYTTRVNDFNKQITELEKQKQFYVVTSPITGTIEEFSGIYVGSILQAGQTIAVISPESEKIAEIYVSAKDIGYLTEGQSTKIQVDAFNYNQWGSLQGEIIDISDDFILADNTPVFNVKCKLNNDYLELKNGVKGKLKKGMTVNARFMIAQRSLFELLYQKSDDWLNPSRNLASQ